jgi:hypothetical protein
MYVNGKMKPVETIPKMEGGEGQRRMTGWGELKYDIFDIL